MSHTVFSVFHLYALHCIFKEHRNAKHCFMEHPQCKNLHTKCLYTIILKLAVSRSKYIYIKYIFIYVVLFYESMEVLSVTGSNWFLKMKIRIQDPLGFSELLAEKRWSNYIHWRCQWDAIKQKQLKVQIWS